MDIDLDIEKESFKYFSRSNFIKGQIVSQQKHFVKYFKETWDELPQERKDILLDSLFVDDTVRQKYAASEKNDSEIKESFPRLYLNSGQKINVDFENDLWTWRDEHSGPFSWMSRSQQDLTLADLEPETISKPQPKQLRKDLDDEACLKRPEPQFTYPSNCWCHDIIEGYKQHEPEIILTPTSSVEFCDSRAGSEDREEINQAFSGSCDDLSTRSSPAKGLDEKNGDFAESEHTDNESKANKKEKDRGRKSPSPMKILRTGSFKKSNSKKVDDQGEEKLIDKNSENQEKEEARAYTNPVMDSEWSSFVGDERPSLQQPSPSAKMDTMSETSPVKHAPETLTIDRGAEPYCIGSSSPYRGDHIKLIQPEDSPAPSVQARGSHKNVKASPVGSERSSESTPDHTTHLLKGLQSPQHHAHAPPNSSHQYMAVDSVGSEKSGREQPVFQAVEQQYEREEVLTVEMRGDNITVTSQVEPKKDARPDSDIPVTGFDFLDNW